MRPLDQDMAWSQLVQLVRPGIADAYADTPQDRVELAKMIMAAASRVVGTHT